MRVCLGLHCDPHKQYHFLDYAAEKNIVSGIHEKKYNLFGPLS